MLMKYFFIFLTTCALLAASTPVNKDKANEKTADLKTQPSETANKNSPDVNPKNVKILVLLQRLEEILKEKADVTLPEFLPVKALRSGDKDDSLIILRQILQSLGYLEKATDSPFFDVELEKAVKAFQAGHCLEADGVIGDGTKERLNWPYAKRLRMIRDSIAKIKNLIFSDRTIIINIPTYSLYAYDASSKLIMNMKAIVGRPNRPTPLITSYINGVEFNPVWVVPYTILVDDELPKIQEDKDFFSKNSMKVFDRNGNEVDSSKVDWNDIDVNDFPYILKQDPGKNNALGLIKFNLQNNDAIYVHDTSHHELFKKYVRALSSGCVRIEQAGKLASWLLDISKDDVKAAIDKGETKTQVLKKPVTVYITYIPVWINEEFGDGRVLWGDDPYNLEPKPFH